LGAARQSCAYATSAGVPTLMPNPGRAATTSATDLISLGIFPDTIPSPKSTTRNYPQSSVVMRRNCERLIQTMARAKFPRRATPRYTGTIFGWLWPERGAGKPWRRSWRAKSPIVSCKKPDRSQSGPHSAFQLLRKKIKPDAAIRFHKKIAQSSRVTALAATSLRPLRRLC
jgi:hypothetical protein